MTLRDRSRLLLTAILGCMLLVVPMRSRADEAANLFNDKCAACHGHDGTSNTPGGKKLGAANLRSKQVQNLSDDALYDTIALGKQHKNYPHAYLFKGLSEPQIKGLVAHIRSFK